MAAFECGSCHRIVETPNAYAYECSRCHLFYCDDCLAQEPGWPPLCDECEQERTSMLAAAVAEAVE